MDTEYENLTRELIACFQDTISFSNTLLLQQTQYSMASSRVYIENFISTKRQNNIFLRNNEMCNVEVYEDTTFHAAYNALSQAGLHAKVAVLNFANPTIPGGGVTRGARAQEESLCRSSNLYPCLTVPASMGNYYQYHTNVQNYYFSDRVIYTNNVTVFKTDDMIPVMMDREKWFQTDVITCAAPFTAKMEYVNQNYLFQVFKSRIKNIFEVAIENEVKILVLGAFGCGAFGNSPEMVSLAFSQVIDENDYREQFDRIIFAIKPTKFPEKSNPNFTVFEKQLKKYSNQFINNWNLNNNSKNIVPRYNTPYNRKSFSILGDSVSTLEGYNPPGFHLFFTKDKYPQTHVGTMEDTWWGKTIHHFGGHLLVNNSWSGSRVTRLPDREQLFPSGCSEERTMGLHFGSQIPDVILVYLGTNDWARGVPLKGGIGAKKTDYFVSAYDMMLIKLRQGYPNAKIFCCTLCHTYMSISPQFRFPENYAGINIEEFNEVIRKIAQKRKCSVIDFARYNRAYDSVDGSHPNSDGMETLAQMAIAEMENIRT